jgi:hypothetical protein
MRTLFTDTKIDLQIIDTGADDETLYGTGVDMDGYTGVAFIAAVNKGEAANFVLKAQQSAASGFDPVADLKDTGKTIAIATGTDGYGFVEVANPQKRYVRPALVCPNVGSAKSIAIISIRYGAKYLPLTNTGGELHVAPAEGDA